MIVAQQHGIDGTNGCGVERRTAKLRERARCALVHTARVERRVGEQAETRDVEAHGGAANVGYANAVNG